jgi:hypothetical protein
MLYRYHIDSVYVCNIEADQEISRSRLKSYFRPWTARSASSWSPGLTSPSSPAAGAYSCPRCACSCLRCIGEGPGLNEVEHRHHRRLRDHQDLLQHRHHLQLFQLQPQMSQLYQQGDQGSVRRSSSIFVILASAQPATPATALATGCSSCSCI